MQSEQSIFKIIQEFIDWCENPNQETHSELKALLLILLKLQIEACQLDYPDGDTTDSPEFECTDESWNAVYKRCESLPFQYYYDTFDPHNKEDTECVRYDLCDDIADIYRDTKEALMEHRAGYTTNALFDLKSQHEYHWGRHAVSAIRAFHCWIVDYGEDED